jgi:surfeit locus 1 family protein
VLTLLFGRLGLWQLSRAQEKESMLQALELAGAETPLTSIGEGQRAEDVVYRQIKLEGHYDYDRQFLLDNRIHQRQAGYEVITPFFPVDSDDFILVNRGWVGHNGDRRALPSIPTATDSQSMLSGVVTIPSKGFAMGAALSEAGDTQNWPLVLQYIDYATIADKVDKIPLLQAVVVADQGRNGDLVFNWQPVSNSPMKHYGYAFQWFAMLTAVLALFVYFNFVRKNNE